MEFVVELGPNSYPVHAGYGLLAGIGELARTAGLGAGRCVVITDSNVGRLYAGTVLGSLTDVGFHAEMIEIPPGEPSKSLATLEQIYYRLGAAELA